MSNNSFFRKIQHLRTNIRERFVLSGVFTQLVVVIAVSLAIIIVTSVFTGSIGLSYEVFIDPPALPKMHENPLFGFVLMFLGLIAFSFIISVVSTSMDKTFANIKKGSLKYYGIEHTLIINYSKKIEKILEELNMHNHRHNRIHDVIVLINNSETIKKLQEHTKTLNYEHLRILIRYGDTLNIKRYMELSILNVRSIILLSDENITDTMSSHNNSLRIIKLLSSNAKFKDYLDKQKKQTTPVKAIVEFSDTRNQLHRSRLKGIVENISDDLFVAVFAKEIVSNIINVSMVDISFYHLWTKLLSFNGYSIYFKSAQDYLGDSDDSWNYKDVLLQQNNGVLLGISRFENNEFKLLLNEQKETIYKSDWLIFIAKNRQSINIKQEKIQNKPILNINETDDTYIKNIIIIGKVQDMIKNHLLDKTKSYINTIEPSDEELYCENFHNEYFDIKSLDEKGIDTVIINLDDEKNYRIALALQLELSSINLERFIFLISDPSMVTHMQSLGIKNIIVPNHLVSRFIAQVSNQITLHDVLNILFVKEGTDINFIDIRRSQTCKELVKDINQLKVELVNSNMVYLGCENNDGEIIFEADDLSNAKKIIVFSEGAC